MIDLNQTAIRRVSFYEAVPVQTCDRCGQGIRHVAVVTYRDGLVQRYGLDCLNKVLDSNPTLRKLFNKNAKLLKRYQDYLTILSGSAESMPRGSEYFGSGLYFVAGSDGKDIAGIGRSGHYVFHPLFDEERNAANGHYVVTDAARRLAENTTAIEVDRIWLRGEIARLESFLAKILRQIPATNPTTQGGVDV